MAWLDRRHRGPAVATVGAFATRAADPVLSRALSALDEQIYGDGSAARSGPRAGSFVQSPVRATVNVRLAGRLPWWCSSVRSIRPHPPLTDGTRSAESACRVHAWKFPSGQGDRFTINAAVNGTLVSPRVALTSDQPGLTENDLVSYLYFGRPSYGITSGQSRALGAAGTLLGSGVTLGLSTFSNRLGSAVAQELGFVDYLSITQQDLGALGDASLGGTFETTVVESGFYVADDFFVTLLLRPLSSQGAGSQFAGIRFEWVASNAYTVESFFEDRFFRGRVLGFGELGIQNEKGFGLYIFREWGY